MAATVHAGAAAIAFHQAAGAEVDTAAEGEAANFVVGAEIIEVRVVIAAEDAEARTGELTPPGKYWRASLYNLCDFSLFIY